MDEHDIDPVAERCATVSTHARDEWLPAVRTAWAAGWDADAIVQAAERGTPPSLIGAMVNLRNDIG